MNNLLFPVIKKSSKEMSETYKFRSIDGCDFRTQTTSVDFDAAVPNFGRIKKLYVWYRNVGLLLSSKRSHCTQKGYRRSRGCSGARSQDVIPIPVTRYLSNVQNSRMQGSAITLEYKPSVVGIK